MFIGRRLDGTIYGSWTSPQPNDEFHPRIEEVPDDHIEYVAFRDRPAPVRIDPINALVAEINDLKLRIDRVETK